MMIPFSKSPLEPAGVDGLDLHIAYQSREILRLLAGRLPSREETESLTSEKGLTLATHVLHQAILATQPHSAFIRHVRSTVPRPQPRASGVAPIEVVFVPSVTPELRLAWGAHTKWMRILAREIGFTTDIIETSPRESITGNARLIGSYLESTRAERVIAVTVGRGSTELRLLLQRRGRSSKDLCRLRGWINIGGAFGGSRTVALHLADRSRSVESRLGHWLRRTSFTALQEMSCETGIWRERMNVHDRMMIVSVFGLLGADRVPAVLKANFDKLSRFGPNDGGVLAYEAMARPGLLYPVPGLSHLAEEVILGPILQRLLTSMSASIYRADHEWERFTRDRQPELTSS